MPVEYKDYYATLGVPREADDEQIRKAFRKLAREYHPDVARDKPRAEERFKEINEAYEVLSDPAKRKRYDTLGAQWKAGAEFEPHPGAAGRRWAAPDGAQGYEFHFGGTGFSDFFERFFGGGGRDAFAEAFGGPDRASGPARGFANPGTDIEGDLLVTLPEALEGSVRTLSLRRTHPQTGQAETHTFKVRIPAGVQDGQTIRVPAQGGEGTGGAPSGDLYLHVRLAAHPDFRVRGADLYHDLALAPWEAVLGTTLEIPTLEGPVKLRIPPGTNTGQQLRVRDRGLPRGAHGARGHLYVVAHIEVPPQISAEERALWDQLRHTSRFNPRTRP